jgi:heme exporter protein B
MKQYSRVFNIVWKDMLSHFRSAETIVSVPFFALITIVVFAFAFNAGQTGAVAEQTAGIIWIAFTFASVIGLSQAFVNEKENLCLKGLLLCPVERHIIFLGKLLVNFVVISIMEVITTPVFLMLFNVSCRITDLIAIIVLTTLGLSAVGTLFSVISSASRVREILFPILFFPIIMPLLITAITATTALFEGKLLGDIVSWIGVIIAFDVLFITISLLIFEATVEE